MAARVIVATLGLAVAAFALAASCDDDGSSRIFPLDSGVEGIVTIGPTCPVERADSPCPDQPYQATIAIEGASGNEVTRFETGEDGRFRVNLAPGTYTIVPESPQSRLPYASEQQVEVSQGSYTRVTIEYDSGIR